MFKKENKASSYPRNDIGMIKRSGLSLTIRSVCMRATPDCRLVSDSDTVRRPSQPWAAATLKLAYHARRQTH